MVNTSGPRLNTIGEIARKLGVAHHRVQYVIMSRAIQPAAYAGRFRLFDNRALARIRYELNRIDATRQGGAE